MTKIYWIIAFLLAPTLAFCQTNESVTNASNSLSFDLIDCTQYYNYASVCASDSGFSEQAVAAAKVAEKGASLAYLLGKSIGMSDAALNARVRLSTAKLKSMIDGKCINIAVLIDRFAAPCERMIDHPTDVLRERALH